MKSKTILIESSENDKLISFSSCYHFSFSQNTLYQILDFDDFEV